MANAYSNVFIFRDNSLFCAFESLFVKTGLSPDIIRGLYNRFFVYLLPSFRTSKEKKDQINQYIHFFIFKMKYLYHCPRFFFAKIKKYDQIFYYLYDRIPMIYKLDRQIQVYAKLFIKKTNCRDL